MEYWDTGDKVIDCILRKIEGFSTWQTDADGESTHQLISGLIKIQEVFPKSVAAHFNIPYLYVGSAHFDRDQKYRAKFIGDINLALKSGLENIAKDPSFKKGGGADFSDRPRSRGEEILDAVRAFKNEHSHSNLNQLQRAVAPTHLQARVQTIEMLMSRQRPYGNQSPKLAILGELHRLEFEAEGYHGQKA